MTNKLKRMIGLTLGALLVLAGCSAQPQTQPTATPAAQGTQAPAKEPGQQLSGTLEVGGSTSVQPLMELFADDFMNTHADVEINVQGGGSGVGITSTVDGLFEIGMSSRELKQEEKDKGLVETTVALDGIAITVNAQNPVTGLTTAQIQQIFKGEVTNWKDVGGNDAPVVVYTREAASGTRGAFLELLKLQQDEKSLITPTALEANSNGSMKTNIAGNANAIGYISLGSVDGAVKALQVDGVAATVETVKDGTYPVYRPFLLLSAGDESDLAKAFIEYILSGDGQAIVEEKGFISNQ
ncbi:MAG: phosphate ABC transporter substrate-binding protein PstS family protein [Eubacteriales bacterium]|nr:phosphate ABC transporter substrate-binding protein PstS family protein [Eubacteriales bacterium]